MAPALVEQKSERALAVAAKYKDLADFLTRCNPNAQAYAAANEEIALTGTAPAIIALVEAYGKNPIEGWLMIQLKNLNDFTGVSKKVTTGQMTEIATLILARYSHLKASELLLFFSRIKAGLYGQFYGVVDPQMITTSLLKYDRNRMAEIAEYKTAAAARELETKRKTWSALAISREEYERRKALQTITTTEKP